MKNNLILFVGTYTQPILFGTGQILEGKGEGIYCYRVDKTTGELSLLKANKGIVNPSYLTLDSSKTHLYSVNELKEFEGKVSGAASAFRLEEDFSLTPLSQQATGGTDPCHINVSDDGSHVFVANFMSGSFCMLPVQENGALAPCSAFVQHEGSSVNPARQKGPHAHSVIFSPDGTRAFVPDLGIDRLMIYRPDYKTGALEPNDPPYFQLPAGSGPRHCVFHPNGRFCYLINELSCVIMVLAYNAEEGSFQLVDSVPSVVGEQASENTCADIHISPDGKFIYGSNRGCDTLVIYRVDAATGKLSYVGTQSSGGKTPRNFAIDPTGELLFSANQDTDNIVVYKIDRENGTLSKLSETKVPTPVCVKAYEW